MRIDSHQHFWKYSAADPELMWIDDTMSAIKRDFLPSDLEMELRRAGLDGSVAVQASQTLAETHFLLKLAAEAPFVKAVVGWVDLCSSELKAQLDALSAQPKLKGVRHVAQAEPDDFLTSEGLHAGVAQLGPRGLCYDILIYERQLPAAIELVKRFPDQPFVVDHIAKPRIKDGKLAPWSELMQKLAGYQNVCCKVSGMITEADWKAWTKEQLLPYLDLVFECFEPRRLMFGSDWPVCTLAGSYSDVFSIVDDYTRGLSEADRAEIFGGTAARFYGL